MFYIWHTILVAVFVAIAFVLGYKLGKKSYLTKKLNFKIFKYNNKGALHPYR